MYNQLCMFLYIPSDKKLYMFLAYFWRPESTAAAEAARGPRTPAGWPGQGRLPYQPARA